jgi:uncharacterized protein (DUF1778 family)
MAVLYKERGWTGGVCRCTVKVMAAKKALKEETIFLRVTKAQKEKLQKAAEVRGLSLTAWLVSSALEREREAARG